MSTHLQRRRRIDGSLYWAPYTDAEVTGSYLSSAIRVALREHWGAQI